MIEFKEGDVFYVAGHRYKAKDKIATESGFGSVSRQFDKVISIKDFKLNEPTNGWYIPKSELDTVEKYNKAVEVFGLFGFSRTGDFALPYSKFTKHEGETALICANNELMGINAEHDECKTKCTFAQLVAIGELKSKMDEREEKFESDFNKVMQAERSDENIKRNKSKQAYDILKGLDYEYDLVKQRWFKKQYI